MHCQHLCIRLASWAALVAQLVEHPSRTHSNLTQGSSVFFSENHWLLWVYVFAFHKDSLYYTYRWGTCTYIQYTPSLYNQLHTYVIYIFKVSTINYVHVLMRDEKEERKKQARSNKQQGKATQHTQDSHMYMCGFTCARCNHCLSIELPSNVEYVEVTIPSQWPLRYLRFIPNSYYGLSTGHDWNRYVYAHYSRSAYAPNYTKALLQPIKEVCLHLNIWNNSYYGLNTDH